MAEWADILELAGRRKIRGRVTRVKAGSVCLGCKEEMPRGAIGFVLSHAAPRGTSADPPEHMGVACPDCMDGLREHRAKVGRG